MAWHLRTCAALSLAASLATVSFAVAQGPLEQPAGAGDRPGGPAGAERASRAGVRIDAGAAELMAQAPAGWCLNDPAAAGCPRVSKIVLAPGSESPEPRAGPAGSEDAASSAGVSYGPAATAASTRARAAQGGFACRLKSLENTVLLIDGNYQARGRGQNICSPPVSYMETYVSLLRFEAEAGGWYTLDIASGRSAGPGTQDLYARYDCDHDRTLAYDTQTFGYAVLNEIGYTGTDHLYANHTCPT